MAEISASILTVDKENAISVFYNLETAKIDYFHIDVMDGKFVEKDNVELMKDYALTISHISNIGLDVHIMVEDIEYFIDEYLDLEPDSITFHIEASKDEERTLNAIDEIKRAGSKVGISISPDTPIDAIIPYLDKIHKVLVMTVVPGKGGQKLIPETIDKVRSLKEYVESNNLDIDIEVDGGINDKTCEEAKEAGANILVVGSYLVSSDNYKETISKLR